MAKFMIVAGAVASIEATQTSLRLKNPDVQRRIVLIDQARTEMVAATQNMAWNDQVGLKMEKREKIGEWLGKISKAYDEYRMDPQAYCDCEAMVGKLAMLNGLGMQAAREQSCGYLTYRISDNLRKAYGACVQAKKPNAKCLPADQAVASENY